MYNTLLNGKYPCTNNISDTKGCQYRVTRERKECTICLSKKAKQKQGSKNTGKMIYVKKKSTKQKQIDAELSKVYAEIKRERPMYCQGCGLNKYLSFSHLVRRSKIRALVADKANIQIHCMTFGEHKGCHEKWESGNYELIKDMNDFDRNLAYLRINDNEAYQKIIDQMP